MNKAVSVGFDGNGNVLVGVNITDSTGITYVTLTPVEAVSLCTSLGYAVKDLEHSHRKS